jgi:hypothetical protein
VNILYRVGDARRRLCFTNTYLKRAFSQKRENKPSQRDVTTPCKKLMKKSLMPNRVESFFDIKKKNALGFGQRRLPSSLDMANHSSKLVGCRGRGGHPETKSSKILFAEIKSCRCLRMILSKTLLIELNRLMGR